MVDPTQALQQVPSAAWLHDQIETPQSKDSMDFGCPFEDTSKLSAPQHKQLFPLQEAVRMSLYNLKQRSFSSDTNAYIVRCRI